MNGQAKRLGVKLHISSEHFKGGASSVSLVLSPEYFPATTLRFHRCSCSLGSTLWSLLFEFLKLKEKNKVLHICSSSSHAWLQWDPSLLCSSILSMTREVTPGGTKMTYSLFPSLFPSFKNGHIPLF